MLEGSYDICRRRLALNLRSAIRTRLLGVILLKPLAETGVTEGMPTICRIGFEHWMYTYSAGDKFPDIIQASLKRVQDGAWPVRYFVVLSLHA